MEIVGVGGYGEVGRNMSLAKLGNDAIILDMGFNIQKLADLEESGGNRLTAGRKSMIKAEAIPDDSKIKSYKDNVKAIAISHCHLDHCGAIPYLANSYKAPIIGTPFTTEVIKNILSEDNISLQNKIRSLNNGNSVKVGDVEIELINVTHSTPSTSLIALHSKEGIIIYGNDFKLDNHPILGQKPDYSRIKEIGRTGKVRAVILDALYSNTEKKTPSELVAREMLKEVMIEEDEGNAMVVTCFASHLARIKSIIDFASKINRRVVLMGRSFLKYVSAAESVGVTHYGKNVDIAGYRNEIKKKLGKIQKKGLEKFVLVATGGQGEPNSVLGRMESGELPFTFSRDDMVIFSNRIIPVEPNIRHRKMLEKKLVDNGLRIFKDVHASGHCFKEDLRDFINMLNPEHVIPCQGTQEHFNGVLELAVEMGYNKKNVHMLKDGEKIKIL
ncbi:MAG: MBL fold metallo-hydrolase [Nanoarchaeota archaeon]